MADAKKALADAKAAWAFERQKIVAALEHLSKKRTVSPCVAISRDMQWQYDSGQGMWCPFSPEANELLLKAYVGGDPWADDNSMARVRSGEKTYAIDFDIANQANIDTEKRRPIRLKLDVPQA